MSPPGKIIQPVQPFRAHCFLFVKVITNDTAGREAFWLSLNESNLIFWFVSLSRSIHWQVELFWIIIIPIVLSNSAGFQSSFSFCSVLQNWDPIHTSQSALVSTWPQIWCGMNYIIHIWPLGTFSRSLHATLYFCCSAVNFFCTQAEKNLTPNQRDIEPFIRLKNVVVSFFIYRENICAFQACIIYLSEWCIKCIDILLKSCLIFQ